MKTNRKRKPAATEADVEIGRKLKELRALKAISQEALAAELDLTFQQVQKYEHGKNRISAVNLHKISRVLDVPMTAFFEENEVIKDLKFDNETRQFFKVWSGISTQEKKDILKMIKLLTKNRKNE